MISKSEIFYYISTKLINFVASFAKQLNFVPFFHFLVETVTSSISTGTKKKKNNAAMIAITVVLGLIILASVAYLIRRKLKKNHGK